MALAYLVVIKAGHVHLHPVITSDSFSSKIGFL